MFYIFFFHKKKERDVFSSFFGSSKEKEGKTGTNYLIDSNKIRIIKDLILFHVSRAFN